MTQMTAVPVIEAEAASLSHAATRYAIRELARRAGVAAGMFASWQIEFDDDGFVNVFVEPGTASRIRFPRTPGHDWKSIAASKPRTSTASWLRPSAKTESLVPDFKIPYSSRDQETIGPLFVLDRPGSMRCSVDLLASLILVLSRFEETLPAPRDEHGRFSAFSSIAWREGFLHRPIVDEWGLAFAEALHCLLPGWRPEEKILRVKVGHDVDEIGWPFRLRSTIAHTMQRHSPRASYCDLLALLGNGDPTYQSLLREIVGLARSESVDTAVYWKCCGPGLHDTGYDPRHTRIRAMISQFQEMGVEMGIHASYQSFDSRTQFRAEVAALKNLLGTGRLGGRQDFLRWRPETWMEWESQGITYDASVGFADHIGFRAGTCHPYHPWLLSRGREAELLEIPLLVMDSTLLGYMRLQADDALQRVREMVARCRAVGGVFTLLWHNTRIMDLGHKSLYQQLLHDLCGSARYEWSSANHEVY